MRFEPTRISSFSQQSFSWKQFFSTGRMKIKTLLSDVFEKSSNNKEVTKKVYISRGLPNSVGAEDEVYNATFGRFEFYPEDIEKMSTMSSP